MIDIIIIYGIRKCIVSITILFFLFLLAYTTLYMAFIVTVPCTPLKFIPSIISAHPLPLFLKQSQ